LSRLIRRQSDLFSRITCTKFDPIKPLPPVMRMVFMGIEFISSFNDLIVADIVYKAYKSRGLKKSLPSV
jgi:hypothetical protein